VRGRAPRHSTRRTGPDSVVRREGEGASGSDDRAGGAKSGPLSPLLRPRLRRTQPRSPVPPADSSSNPVTSKPEQGKPPDQGAPSNRRKNCATGCSHRLKPHSSAARVPPLVLHMALFSDVRGHCCWTWSQTYWWILFVRRAQRYCVRVFCLSTHAISVYRVTYQSSIFGLSFQSRCHPIKI
jgi:hypothetical protein